MKRQDPDSQTRRDWKVLIWSPRWLGDAILAAPALQALNSSSWVGRLDILAPEGLREFYSMAGLGSGFLAQEPRASLVRRIREGQYDAGILLPRSFRSAWVFKRAGVSRRYGLASEGRGFLLTHKFSGHPSRSRHLSAEYFDWAGQAGAEPRPGQFDGRQENVFGPMRSSVGSKPKGLPPTVIFHAGSAYGPAKRWPMASFVGLARGLGKEGVRILIIGTKAEKEMGRILSQEAGVVDATGHTGLRDLAGLMSLSDVFVGNDSGPLHLASALGLAVVGLYGSTSPLWTSPLGNNKTLLWGRTSCSPCYQKKCAVGTRCMDLVTVERVAKEVWRYLKKAA